jgi:hypothetical protein
MGDTYNKLQKGKFTKYPVITIKGYFVNHDKWDRVKLMFLDDYDELPKLSFTKSYMINKLNKTVGKAPLDEDNKYMIINCPKNALGYLPNTIKNKTLIKAVPIKELIQHKVQCDVVVKNYRFKKNNKLIQGWTIKLSEMTLLDY